MGESFSGAEGCAREVTLRKYITENIDRAIAEGWIRVHYQPIIRGATGHVCSEEALARWKEPGGTELFPDDFIPVLEDAGLIDGLDLYIIDRIIDDFNIRKAAGLYLVPVSVNLSRVDFENCDIVEEIKRRTDEAGLDRRLLQIEITESTMGSDFDRMKTQIGLIRESGFKILMDDFGSGYSSLDFLQRTDFNAVKLDLNFMREFETNEKTRIIVTRLVRMITALGMETIAEGVETDAQFEFLREIGCAKMQGYYFCPAISIEDILARYREGRQIGFENPDEIAYYDRISGISLFELDQENAEDETALQKYFDTIPVAILEYNGEKVRIVRCNRNFKEFLTEVFGIRDFTRGTDHAPRLRERNSGVFELFEQCRGFDRRLMFEDAIGADFGINGFIRHCADNEISGYSAFTVAILSTSDMSESPGVTFARAARALLSDYLSLYYVNEKTDDFIEYTPDAEHSNLSVERHGRDFFNESARDALDAIYPGDRERFIADFNKDNILNILRENGSFALSYRLMLEGEPIYVSMKAVRIDPDHIVIGVSNVDSYMRHKEALERAREESLTYTRITALSGEYIAIYTVDPSNDDYIEYSATKAYEDLGLDKTGKDFFESTLRLAEDTVFPEDLQAFRMICTKDNIMRDIRENGLFEFDYRLLIDGEPVHVSLKAALVEEKDGPRIIVGVSNVEERYKRSQEYEASLQEARDLAAVDSLTGVKSKRAYLDAEALLNEEISSGLDPEFAIVMLDLNGLKAINDAHGHQTGDNFLKAGCRAICDIFGHSPVYRVGGDEFVVIARDRDYEHIHELVGEMHDHNLRCIRSHSAAAFGDISEAKLMSIDAASHDRDSSKEHDYENANAGQVYDFDPDDIVIACGMARYEGDMYVSDVFDRADLAMYENKKELKSR